MEQYTRGKWEAWDKYVVCDGVTIARVDKLANAHLISASPDMYEALKYASAFCEAVEQGLVAVATRDMVRDIIDQAIAKVENR